MWFEDFQHGHLGYRNRTILAIQNLCRSDTSHQISAQFNLRFGRKCCLKTYKMAIMAAILDTPMPPTKFQLNLTYDSEGDVENVKI